MTKPTLPTLPTLKERLKAHFAEYGKVAIWTYVILSLCTIAGFSIAFGFGLQPSSATGVLGVIGAGWLAAKATMPIRILITLGLTPAISALIVRRKAKQQPPVVDEVAAEAPAEEPAVTGS